MKSRLPLSVCMIVRDEERLLPAAIESLRPLVAEVVVVDTGSRDRSMDIARSLGARVLSFAWCDDFSAARNVALDAAQGPWILSLDADQRLDPRSAEALAQAVRRPGLAQTVHIDLMGEDPAGAQPQGHYEALRLFRRDPRIRYRGRVHEDVAASLLDLGCSEWPDSGVRLRDEGYGSAAERQRKRDRNVLLLEQAHAEQPGDLFVRYKLAITLPETRAAERLALLADGVAQARRLSTQAARALPFLPSLLAAAVDAWIAQGRLCQAAEAARALAPVLGGSSHFTAGQVLARAAQFDAAVAQLNQYLATGSGPAHPAVRPDPDATRSEALRWLGWAAASRGDLTQARDWLQQALQAAAPGTALPIECELLRLDLRAGDLARVAGQLDRLAEQAHGTAAGMQELMLLSAELAVAAGDADGARALAQAALGSTDDRAAALLARLALRSGDAEPARLRESMARIPGRRFDTLAQRLVLARRLGEPLAFELPAASVELADELR